MRLGKPHLELSRKHREGRTPKRLPRGSLPSPSSFPRRQRFASLPWLRIPGRSGASRLCPHAVRFRFMTVGPALLRVWSKGQALQPNAYARLHLLAQSLGDNGGARIPQPGPDAPLSVLQNPERVESWPCPQMNFSKLFSASMALLRFFNTVPLKAILYQTPARLVPEGLFGRQLRAAEAALRGLGHSVPNLGKSS